jgi:nitrite reductase/ring-hydroxylating ferredoxin subunit
MKPDPDRFIRVGSLAELEANGRMVVKGRRCPLLVVHDQGRVFALDDRCPHLGFALHQGSIRDGILTCPWHHGLSKPSMSAATRPTRSRKAGASSSSRN